MLNLNLITLYISNSWYSNYIGVERVFQYHLQLKNSRKMKNMLYIHEISELLECISTTYKKNLLLGLILSKILKRLNRTSI